MNDIKSLKLQIVFLSMRNIVAIVRGVGLTARYVFQILKVDNFITKWKKQMRLLCKWEATRQKISYGTCHGTKFHKYAKTTLGNCFWS